MTLDSSALRRLQAKRVDELSSLFAKQRSALKAMVAGRIQGKLAARFDASDVVQDTFLRANKQLAAYLKNPTLHPIVWLRVLCKQLLAENIRRHLRLRRSPKFETHDVVDQVIADRLADSIDSISDASGRNDTLQKVQSVLAKLNHTDREIIDMRHAEGLAFQEIADLLEMKMETAKKRYYRALDKFRSLTNQA